MTQPNKTLLITGVSSGFGQAIAEKALTMGHTVIGTVRKPDDIEVFESLDPNRAHGQLLDITDTNRVLEVVTSMVNKLGPIDVLINNAGYGHEGILEESSLDDIRHQFDVNVFGAISMIKAVLPFMRKRRKGNIFNITSMGGYITMPGITDYCGSKFALVGISDALAKELAPFNISVTSIAPGSFRTDWAGRSMVRTPRSIQDYDRLFNPIRQAREAKHGHQLGDPQKAASAILSLLDIEKPPRHLLLGSDALTLVREHLQSFSEEIQTWEALTRSTDG